MAKIYDFKALTSKGKELDFATNLQKVQIAFLGLVAHVFPDCEIHDTGNDNHHYQNHRHDVVGEPCR